MKGPLVPIYGSVAHVELNVNNNILQNKICGADDYITKIAARQKPNCHFFF
jgi:hypothetical protein